nr:S-phase kinase-associated protein 1-like [Drosophila kikkawai]
MPTVRLESSDKEIFTINLEVIKCSDTIRTALKDLGDLDDCGVFPLPNVSSMILRMVLNWATYHKDDPIVLEEDDSKEKCSDDLCPWDVQFLNVDQGTLFELILAANYLNIQGLLTATCKTVANMIKGKTPDEIRATFAIEKE